MSAMLPLDTSTPNLLQLHKKVNIKSGGIICSDTVVGGCDILITFINLISCVFSTRVEGIREMHQHIVSQYLLNNTKL